MQVWRIMEANPLQLPSADAPISLRAGSYLFEISMILQWRFLASQ